MQAALHREERKKMHLMASSKEDAWSYCSPLLSPEGSQGRAGRTVFDSIKTSFPCCLENGNISEVQNNLTQLTSSFLDFFSEKVNVTRSDRLLWNLLANSKTATKSIIFPSPLQICLQWWIACETMETIQSRVQRTSVCNFSIWYSIST